MSVYRIESNDIIIQKMPVEPNSTIEVRTHTHLGWEQDAYGCRYPSEDGGHQPYGVGNCKYVVSDKKASYRQGYKHKKKRRS